VRPQAIDGGKGDAPDRAAVLGAGSWGTALALHLARSGRPVILWGRSEEAVRAMRSAGENAPYLPGQKIPTSLGLTARLGEAIEGSGLVLFVVPAQHLRPVFRAAASTLHPAADLVVASKGIEEGSLLRMTQVLAQEAGERAARRATVLSGPSFAAEVA